MKEGVPLLDKLIQAEVGTALHRSSNPLQLLLLLLHPPKLQTPAPTHTPAASPPRSQLARHTWLRFSKGSVWLVE